MRRSLFWFAAFARLSKHIVQFAWFSGHLWLIPVLAMLFGIGALAVSTQVATPFLYTLF